MSASGVWSIRSGGLLSVTYPSASVSYTYDSNNRLESADGTDYDYDWVGNRLRYPPANPSPMVYDATDKLVTWPGQHQYTYYPTGSLHEQKNSGGTVQKTFAYTGAELLSSVTHAGVANPSLMEWDADSNRVSFTSSKGTGTWEFVYDTTAGIPAVIEENDGDPVYYIREPNGALIARVVGTALDASSTRYYHFDALGSTRKLTDKDGVVTDTYTYDAWGNTTHTGSTEQPYQYVGRYGYYTHWQDDNLDLLQLGVRFYDPETGRFTQVDPAKDGLNWYAYVDDAPLHGVDPSGLSMADIGYYWPDTWGDFLDAWYEYYVFEPQGQDFLDCMSECYKDFYSIGNLCPWSLPGLAVGTGISWPKWLSKLLGQRVIRYGNSRRLGNPWRQWIHPIVGKWWKRTYHGKPARGSVGRALQVAFWVDGGLEMGNMARCLGRCLAN